jgi:hypothetical protein
MLSPKYKVNINDWRAPDLTFSGPVESASHNIQALGSLHWLQLIGFFSILLKNRINYGAVPPCIPHGTPPAVNALKKGLCAGM